MANLQFATRESDSLRSENPGMSQPSRGLVLRAGTRQNRPLTVQVELEDAEEHPGSWWPDWQAWIEEQDGKRVPAREIGGGKLAPIEDAPGQYVQVKS